MQLREAEQAVAEVVEFVEQFRAELGRSERRRNCSQYFSGHGSISGKTPWEKWIGLAGETPIWEEIEQRYDSSKERIREQNY